VLPIGFQDCSPLSRWRFIHKVAAVKVDPYLFAAKLNMHMGRLVGLFSSVYQKLELSFSCDNWHVVS